MTETGGKAKFDKVLREKTRKGYKPVDVLSVTTAPGRPDNTLLRATAAASLAGGSSDKVVTTLVDRLVAANKHNLMAASGNLITVDLHGQARTALGPISASAVADARAVLNQLVGAQTPATRKELTEQYLSIVPQAVARHAGRGWAENWLGTHTTHQKQTELLDALDASASYAAATTARKSGGVDEDFFRYRVTRLEEGSEEHQMILDRFASTKQDFHSTATLRPKYLYRLEDRQHGAEVAATAERVRNVQRLWHGTGAANVLSILQKGLFVPPTSGSGIHIAGRMFGDGIYLSRSATKSLNYSAGVWGGGKSPSTFMFLTLTAMGYEYRPTGTPVYGRRFRRPDADENGKRYDSISVLPGTTSVRNHEAIVPDPMQVNLQWLVEF